MGAPVAVTAADLATVGLMPSGVMASGVAPIVSGGSQAAATLLPALGDSAAKASLFNLNPASFLNPASLIFGLAMMKILSGKSNLQATPMTPEEAAKFAGQQRLDTALGGIGEGAGEFLLDAIEQAKAANVSPEQIAEILNTRGDLNSEIIGLTVGSNQMLSDADMAAAQAASQAAAEETVDLTEDTTASTITGGLGDGSLGDAADLGTVEQGAVSDVNEEWTYDKATDSFISSTRGDRIPNRGNADLRDGGVYTVTPVIGTDGVTAEHVVDTETNKSVGIFNIDINTGLPSITKSVDTGSVTGDTNTTTTTTGDSTVTGTGDTTVTGNGDTTVTGGGDSTVITTGGTTTTGTETTDTAVTDETDQTVGNTGGGVYDFFDFGTNTDTTMRGGGGGSRKGMMASIINQTPVTESLLVKPMMRSLDNIPVGMFEQFMRAAGGR